MHVYTSRSASDSRLSQALQWHRLASMQAGSADVMHVIKKEQAVSWPLLSMLADIGGSSVRCMVSGPKAAAGMEHTLPEPCLTFITSCHCINRSPTSGIQALRFCSTLACALLVFWNFRVPGASSSSSRSCSLVCQHALC